MPRRRPRRGDRPPRRRCARLSRGRQGDGARALAAQRGVRGQLRHGDPVSGGRRGQGDPRARARALRRDALRWLRRADREAVSGRPHGTGLALVVSTGRRLGARPWAGRPRRRGRPRRGRERDPGRACGEPGGGGCLTALPPFERHRPATVEEATELFERHGDDAVAYVGGTELFLLFKFGFAEYPHVIDLKAIDELRGIERSNGELRIGAAETHRAIERHPTVRGEWPALAAMERGVGNLRVRTMGSIGGNLCFADPHSDPATFLLAMNGELEARRGGAAARRIALAEFVRGPFENALVDGELLTAVLVPELAARAAIVHRKFVLHERPAITVACHLRLDEPGAPGKRLVDVRLAVGSAGVTAARAAEAEQLLEGASVGELDGVLEGVGELAADAADPVEDANGSVEYKRNLVAVLSRRAVKAAVGEARGGEHGLLAPGES
ncbi:MAG: hypothetical protein GEU88_19370 [Solirubrobacterales bacterium]|nr:hypothetical protein [Solirubrobacterales bacterium]